MLVSQTFLQHAIWGRRHVSKIKQRTIRRRGGLHEWGLHLRPASALALSLAQLKEFKDVTAPLENMPATRKV